MVVVVMFAVTEVVGCTVVVGTATVDVVDVGVRPTVDDGE